MTDLRLAPVAVLCWATAALAVGLGATPTLWAGAVFVVLSGCLGLGYGAWRRSGSFGASIPTLVRRTDGREHRCGREPRNREPSRWARPAIGHVMVAAAGIGAVLVSAGVNQAVRADLVAQATKGFTAQVSATVAGSATAMHNPFSGSSDRYRLPVEAREVTIRGVRTTVHGPVTVMGSGPAPHLAFGAHLDITGTLALDDDGAVILRTSSDPHVTRPPPVILRVVDEMRSALMRATDTLPQQTRGLTAGIAIGDTSGIGDDQDAALKTTSLTHITAVSGGHFAIIVATIGFLCSVRPVPRAVRVAVLALVMWGFVALVYPQPSVLRAAGMCAVGLCAVLTGRPSRALPALCATVCVLLIGDPWLARSYGFVLSVAATAGLSLLTVPIAARLERLCGTSVAHVIAIPIAAQAACAPVLILLDPKVAVYSVPANLLAAPALGPATVLGVAAAVIGPVWPWAAWALVHVAGVFSWWIATVAEFFAAAPGSQITWPAGVPGAVLLAVLTCAVLVAVTHWRRAARAVGIPLYDPPTAPPRQWWRTGWRPVHPRVNGARRSARAWPLLAVVIVIVLVLALRPFPLFRAGGVLPEDWAVGACDVGQGDALAIRTGPQSAMLIDAGPDGHAADACLDRLGVRHLDLLVLTHFHADHVGGVPAVLKGRTVDKAVVGPDWNTTGARFAIKALKAANVPMEQAATGMSGAAGEARWAVLQTGVSRSSSMHASNGEDSAANDGSVVMRVDVAGLRVVALGDLEEAGQDQLARQHQGDLAGVDVVKVAHHGSASQSAALAVLLHPAVAIISSGANTYGHPTDAALDLYQGQGSALVRTDQCGTFALVNRADRIALTGCGSS